MEEFFIHEKFIKVFLKFIKFLVQIMAQRMAKICPKQILGSKIRKSKSTLGIITYKIKDMQVFRQNGQLWVFRSKFGEIAQLRAIFWFL